MASYNRAAAPPVDLGRLDEAKRLYDLSLEMGTRVTGPGSVYRVLTYQGDANIAALQGDLATAQGHFDMARGLAASLLREDHRYVLDLEHDYAAFLVRAGRPAEAVEVLEGTLERQRARLPRPHPQIDRTAALLREAREVGSGP